MPTAKPKYVIERPFLHIVATAAWRVYICSKGRTAHLQFARADGPSRSVVEELGGDVRNREEQGR
jgi:hypothetical protein